MDNVAMLDVSILGLAGLAFGLLVVCALLWRAKKQTEQTLLLQQQADLTLKEKYALLQAEQTSMQQARQQIQTEYTTLQTTHHEQHMDLATTQQQLEMQRDLRLKEEQKALVLSQELDVFRQQCTKLQTHIAQLTAEYSKDKQANAEKISLLEDAKVNFTQEFKLLANQILEEKQQKMTVSSQESLNHIIKPMQKDISEFKMRMEQVHKEDLEARSALAQHLQHLQQLNQKMSQDALNLTQALKGDNKAQGNWGEMILEKLLESSGLREGYEFEREQSFVNDEGKRQRPDVIIRMPGDKQVIIDAKVSLTHYERAMSSDDDGQRQQLMRAHIKSIQTHIQTLADKRYDHLDGVHSPDYVLMFMPIEAAYLMAIEVDSSIFEAAFDKRIAVVTPSTLYATLKLIEQLWRYERQSENVAKLTKQAGNLHDKFVGFIESFEDIQIHIGRAQKSYEKSLGQLKDGRGNLVNQVKTLADLSGKAKKEIPEHLLDDNSPHLAKDSNNT